MYKLRTQDGYFLEEGLVQLPLPDGASHENPAVGVTINGPQLHISLGLNGRCPGSAVDQGKLTKASTLADGASVLIVDIYL